MVSSLCQSGGSKTREADQTAAETPPAKRQKTELSPPLQAASASPPSQAASSSGSSGEAIRLAGQAAFGACAPQVGPVDTHPVRLTQRPVAGCSRCRYSQRGCPRCKVQTASTEEMEEAERAEQTFCLTGL